MEEDLGLSIEKKVRRIKAYLDGTLTPEEENEFHCWLEVSEANRVLLDRIQSERVLLDKIRFHERHDKSKTWNSIHRKIRRRPVVLVSFTRYAAILVVVLFVGIAVYQFTGNRKDEDRELLAQVHRIPAKGGYKAYLELATGERLVLDSISEVTARVEGAVITSENKGTVIVNEQVTDSVVEKVEYNRLVIPRGGEYKIVLADGSRVWINSQTVLEFPARFAGKERRVKLTGEAYFEVSKHAEKPFIVEVGDKEVRVLGTSFNVNDYNDKFVTTLETGKVKVRVGENDYILDPSMQICMEDGNVALKKVDTKEFTAWKDGLFVFKKQKLQDVLDILSRWYDIDVFYQNENLKDLHFTGTIERHNNIADVVKFLEKTDMVKFSINGKSLVVSK